MSDYKVAKWIAMDLHIADEIVATLDEWFENGIHSYPPNLSSEEWEGVLTEIRKGFAAFRILSESTWSHPSDVPAYRELFEKGLVLFAKHFEDLWD